MELDLVYLSSDSGVVKKDGINFGKGYYIHKFMFNCEVIDIFEFADNNGKYKIYDSLDQMKLSYLDRCVGEFEIFVSNNKLQLKLVDIR